MAARRSSAPLATYPPSPVFYTGPEVARFCEVDLKTIHAWVDRGKLTFQRTEGRHLRFRRNHVLDLLHSLGYPIPEELRTVRARVALGTWTDARDPEAVSTSWDALHRALSDAFDVRLHDSGAVALAHLVAHAPDALILHAHDATIAGISTIEALGRAAETSFVALVVMGPASVHASALEAGAKRAFCAENPQEIAHSMAELLDVEAPRALPRRSARKLAQRPAR